MPSISGASRWERPTPDRVDEHLDPATDELVAPAGGDRVLDLGQLGEPLGDQLLRHLAVEAGRVRPVLATEGEEPAPVELGRLDEAQQLVVVALGLAGIPDDEVAAEDGVGLAPADLLDAAEEARRRPPSGASAAATAC